MSARRGFPGGSVVKNPPANKADARDTGSTPGSGRSPGERNGNPLQGSCLGNPTDQGAWRATVHEVTRIGRNGAPTFAWARKGIVGAV